MTKLEEIARALCEADERNGGAPWDYGMPGDEKWNERRHQRYRESASAAVEALREPSEAMKDRGANLVPDQPGFDEGYEESVTSEIWTAMIDAILNEKPE